MSGWDCRALGVLALLFTTAAVSATAQSPTAGLVAAANTFLSTLDAKQKQSVLFAFDDDRQRVRWSNLPVRMVPRAGVSLGELNPGQRSAALALVSAALSKRGFEKVQEIMEGDEMLKNNDRNGSMFGKDLYFI